MNFTRWDDWIWMGPRARWPLLCLNTSSSRGPLLIGIFLMWNLFWTLLSPWHHFLLAISHPFSLSLSLSLSLCTPALHKYSLLDWLSQLCLWFLGFITLLYLCSMHIAVEFVGQLQILIFQDNYLQPIAICQDSCYCFTNTIIFKIKEWDMSDLRVSQFIPCTLSENDGF